MNTIHESPLHAAAPSPKHCPPCPLSPPDLRISHPPLSTDSVCRVTVGRQMLLKAVIDIPWAYAPLPAANPVLKPRFWEGMPYVSHRYVVRPVQTHFAKGFLGTLWMGRACGWSRKRFWQAHDEVEMQHKPECIVYIRKWSQTWSN